MKQPFLRLGGLATCFLAIACAIYPNSQSASLPKAHPSGLAVYDLLHQFYSKSSCSKEKLELIKENQSFIIQMGTDMADHKHVLQNMSGNLPDYIWWEWIDSGKIDLLLEDVVANLSLLTDPKRDPKKKLFWHLSEISNRLDERQIQAIFDLLHVLTQMHEEVAGISPNTLYYASYIPTSFITGFCFDGDFLKESFRQKICHLGLSLTKTPPNVTKQALATGDILKDSLVLKHSVDLGKLWFGSFLPHMKPISLPMPSVQKASKEQWMNLLKDFLKPNQNQPSHFMKLTKLLWQLGRFHPDTCQPQLGMHVTQKELESAWQQAIITFPTVGKQILSIFKNRHRYQR